MKYKQEVETEKGWTHWIYPNRKSYRMKCCDCGLVHDVQFKLEDFGRLGKKILYRVRRHERATGQARRYLNPNKNL